MFFFSDAISNKYAGTGKLVTFDMPHLYKFYDSVAIKVTGQSGLNWTYYRYADILLMLTEVNWTLRALGESVSDNDMTKGINEVRARALLAPISAANLTLLNIMSERAYELIFENKMVFDQRRTRRCLVDGDGKFADLQSFFGHRPVDFSFGFGAMNLLSPISGTEIINNAQCMQNSGYLPKQKTQ
jgi:hypothetical protein